VENKLDSLRVDPSKLREQVSEDKKKDSIEIKNHDGRLITIKRWKDGKVVAWGKFGLYIDASCPKCYGNQFIKKSLLGSVECRKCKNVVLLETIKRKRAELIYIHSHEKGKGYARDIIEFMKEKNDRLVTSWDDSTEEGRGLCLACGMTRYDSLLVWGKMDG
jgi:hypothetical protein